MAECYVYVIFRPNGSPCYVGKGSGNRWKQHAKRSHNRHLKAIYARAGGDLPTVLLREGLTDDEALAIETALIAAIGRKANGGPLVNQTDGGEGVRGLQQSAEANERRRLKNLGQKRSAETCAKIGDVHRGKTVSEEARRRLSEAHKGKTASADTRAKMAQKRRGVPRPQHVIDALRKANTGRFYSDETRAKIGAANQGRKLSEEGRRKRSEALRAAYQDPEARKRLSDAVKRSWETRRSRKQTMGDSACPSNL